MSTLTLITTTVATADDARQLATACVQARLAACVQIEKVTSYYVWEEQAKETTEWRMVFKTMPQSAPAMRVWLRHQHPYQVPEVLTQTVEVEVEYAQWVRKQVG